MEREINYQCRSINLDKFETRADGDNLYIEGYFVVFDSNYQLFDGGTESVAKGAFDDALDADIRCLVDHDTRLVLGRTTNGTLELKQDDHGLWGKVLINTKDVDAMNLYERVKRGDVSQCSFGFEIKDEETEYLDENHVHWTIKAVKLYEVSIVTFPAYEETAVKARQHDLETIKERKAQAWKEEMLKKLRKD